MKPNADNVVGNVICGRIEFAKIEIGQLDDFDDLTQKQLIFALLINNEFWKISHLGTRNLLEILTCLLTGKKFKVESSFVSDIYTFFCQSEISDKKWKYDLLLLLRLLVKYVPFKDSNLRKRLLMIGDYGVSLALCNRNHVLFDFRDCNIYVFDYDGDVCLNDLSGKCCFTKFSMIFTYFQPKSAVRRIEIPLYCLTDNVMRGDFQYDYCFVVPHDYIDFLICSMKATIYVLYSKTDQTGGSSLLALSESRKEDRVLNPECVWFGTELIKLQG